MYSGLLRVQDGAVVLAAAVARSPLPRPLCQPRLFLRRRRAVLLYAARPRLV